MNAIPLTTLDALIWKTCRVKLNERELRALVLLLISLVNIAFALIDICLQAKPSRAKAYQGYWSACFYLIAGALGTAASFQPSSKQLLLAAFGFSALSVPLSILSFILSLSVGSINENAGLIVISLLALGSCGIESFHLRSMLLTIENPVSAVNESLIKKPSEGNIEGATAMRDTNYQNMPNPSEYSPV